MKTRNHLSRSILLLLSFVCFSFVLTGCSDDEDPVIQKFQSEEFAGYANSIQDCHGYFFQSDVLNEYEFIPSSTIVETPHPVYVVNVDSKYISNKEELAIYYVDGNLKYAYSYKYNGYPDSEDAELIYQGPIENLVFHVFELEVTGIEEGESGGWGE